MRADRLLAILLLLQGRGKMTTRSLAQELNVSRRTILRDLDSLSGAGIPVYAEGGPGGGVYLDRDYRTSLTGLQEAEIQALFLSAGNSLLDEIGLGEAARSTLRKLAAALPVRQQPLVEQMRQRFLIDPYWWWASSQPVPCLEELQRAVFEDRPIRAVYERYDGQIGERELEPYALVAKSSDWYLVALRAGEFRIYRASRFRQVTIMAQQFQRRKDFDLALFWQEHAREFIAGLTEIRFTLLIDPDRMVFIQGLLPGRYQILGAAESGTWLKVHFQLESMDLAKMLVFGLGTQAAVLDSPDLDRTVREAAREFLAHHNSPDRSGSLPAPSRSDRFSDNP